MAPDPEDRPAADTAFAGLTAPSGLAGLRDAWRRRSLASGWLSGGDWDSQEVDEVLAACRDRAPAPGEAGLAVVGDDALTAACAGLGRSRARAGIGIGETIDDLAALFAVLAAGPEGDPEARSEGQPGHRPDRNQAGAQAGELPLHLVCAVAEGWAEECLDQLAQGGCEDPLSGLATLPYLRTRLAEVYREAEQAGTSPAGTHRLLVVGLPYRPDPWRRMALAILIGHDLRTAFPGGETLSIASHYGTGPAIALVRAHGELPLRYARLRRSIQATYSTQIRMTPLPGLLTEALRLVDELAR